MASTILVKCFSTKGRLPKKNPAPTNPPTHNNAPITLEPRKRQYGIAPTPATNGAKVRTIGAKRARITARAPCFSKKALVFSRCPFLSQRYFPLNARGPMARPMR